MFPSKKPVHKVFQITSINTATASKKSVASTVITLLPRAVISLAVSLPNLMAVMLAFTASGRGKRARYIQKEEIPIIGHRTIITKVSSIPAA